jgi:pimeloyl-ACP methyl ester carboxylesterase
MAILDPFISFRNETIPSGGLQTPLTSPPTALHGMSVLLLIHGYNNNVEDASDSYAQWLRLQDKIAPVSANVVAVYWPGDNWEGGAYYVQALPKAKETATGLANVLLSAATSFGAPLRVTIVAHSLGARIAYELVSRLQGSAVFFERIAVMAAAVTTRSITNGAILRLPLDHASTALMSLYSEADKVLRFAFPLGETVAGEGFFPTALGRTKWSGGGSMPATQLLQQDVNGSGHGDYWRATGTAGDVPRLLRAFLPIGGVAPRQTLLGRAVPERDQDTRMPLARETIARAA